MFFLYERVQAKTLTKCGRLLGSHPGVFNTDNISQVVDKISPSTNFTLNSAYKKWKTNLIPQRLQ